MTDEFREPVTIGEFTRWSTGFERRLQERFDRVDEKQDDHAARLTLLERDVQAWPTSQPSAHTRARLAAWGSASAGAIVVIWEFVKALVQTRATP